MHEYRSRNHGSTRGKLKVHGRVLSRERRVLVVYVALVFAGLGSIAGGAGIALAQTGGVTQSTTTPNFTNVGSAGSIFTKLWVGTVHLAWPEPIAP